jgi:hypothetical protein
MIRFEKQTFDQIHSGPPGGVHGGYEFDRCTFFGCGLGGRDDDPARRTYVRDVHARRCRFDRCGVGPAFFDEATIDGATIVGNLIIFGAVFRHVTLRGPIRGNVIYNAEYEWSVMPTYDPRAAEAFREANTAHWASVDWALDISEARCSSLEIRGIPARVIRRDPATQVVVTRETALEGRWRSLDLGPGWGFAIGFIARGEAPDGVLVGSTIGKRVAADAAVFRLLREEGIAEPD